MTEPVTGPELADWLARAERIARAGGDVLRAHARRRRSVVLEFKGRRELVTEADRAAEQEVVTALQREFPDHAILAEEGVRTPRGRADKQHDYQWIVDPLDGTTNFVHAIPFYCVSIALAFRGEPVLGVVHAPELDRTYGAARGLGAHCNGERLQVSRTAQVTDALVCTGFSYNRNEPGAESNLERLARVLPHCRDLRRLGSAELDLCLTAAGTYDGYWELYLMPYDVAAGAVLVQEAGGRVTDLQGRGDWLHGGQILATNGALHDELLALVGGPVGAA